MTDDTTTLLKQLGFTDYEARAYVSLVGADSRNGYEVAKAAGMPRANVYPVLERLVERGAARRLTTRKGKRYAAVRPAQLLEQLERQHRRTLAAADTALATLEQAESTAPVYNLSGYNELLGKARATIDAAEHSLLVGIQPGEAAALADPLREARERGVAITTLCMEACDNECGGCQGAIHRYDLMPSAAQRWLLLVGDERHAIAGEIHTTGASAVETEHRQIIALIDAFIRQSLALAPLGDDLGDQFEGLLSRTARQVLATVQPRASSLARLLDIADENFKG